jgi:hypothetical protein
MKANNSRALRYACYGLIVVIGAVAFFQLRKVDDGHKPVTEAEVNSGSAGDPPATGASAARNPSAGATNSRVDHNVVSRSGAPLSGKVTYGDLVQKLDPVWRVNADARDILVRVASACGSTGGKGRPRRPEIPVGPKQMASEDYAHLILAMICDGPREDELSKYQSFVTPLSLRDDLYDANNKPKHENAALAFDAFFHSQSPAEIELASQFLASGTDWDYGRSTVLGTALEPKLPELQQAALKLLLCSLSGGCGPDEFTSITMCGAYNLCEPGISVSDIYSQIYSPMELSAIYSMYLELAKARSAG